MSKNIILKKSTSDLFEKIMDYPNDDIEGLLGIAKISPEKMLYLIDKNWGRDDDEVKKIAIELENIIDKKGRTTISDAKGIVTGLASLPSNSLYGRNLPASGLLFACASSIPSFAMSSIYGIKFFLNCLFESADSSSTCFAENEMKKKILINSIKSKSSASIKRMFLKRINGINDVVIRELFLKEIKEHDSHVIKNNLIESIRCASKEYIESIFRNDINSSISKDGINNGGNTEKCNNLIEKYISTIPVEFIHDLFAIMKQETY